MSDTIPAGRVPIEDQLYPTSAGGFCGPCYILSFTAGLYRSTEVGGRRVSLPRLVIVHVGVGVDVGVGVCCLSASPGMSHPLAPDTVAQRPVPGLATHDTVSLAPTFCPPPPPLHSSLHLIRLQVVRRQLHFPTEGCVYKRDNRPRAPARLPWTETMPRQSGSTSHEASPAVRGSMLTGLKLLSGTVKDNLEGKMQRARRKCEDVCAAGPMPWPMSGTTFQIFQMTHLEAPNASTLASLSSSASAAAAAAASTQPPPACSHRETG
ncbi:unnamed protein product [Protopolystoma xenopodis]|uniref:Uncharacterized protein n=1 Tax=Protopolystoma xenopodis TaxID=117903 RepID=A0A3S5CDR5_9PLAT|nr:unnamed protein product [Protopolystoma xenopodis]